MPATEVADERPLRDDRPRGRARPRPGRRLGEADHAREIDDHASHERGLERVAAGSHTQGRPIHDRRAAGEAARRIGLEPDLGVVPRGSSGRRERDVGETGRRPHDTRLAARVARQFDRAARGADEARVTDVEEGGDPAEQRAQVGGPLQPRVGRRARRRGLDRGARDAGLVDAKRAAAAGREPATEPGGKRLRPRDRPLLDGVRRRRRGIARGGGYDGGADAREVVGRELHLEHAIRPVGMRRGRQIDAAAGEPHLRPHRESAGQRLGERRHIDLGRDGEVILDQRACPLPEIALRQRDHAGRLDPQEPRDGAEPADRDTAPVIGQVERHLAASQGDDLRAGVHATHRGTLEREPARRVRTATVEGELDADVAAPVEKLVVREPRGEHGGGAEWETMAAARDPPRAGEARGRRHREASLAREHRRRAGRDRGAVDPGGRVDDGGPRGFERRRCLGATHLTGECPVGQASRGIERR